MEFTITEIWVQFLKENVLVCNEQFLIEELYNNRHNAQYNTKLEVCPV